MADAPSFGGSATKTSPKRNRLLLIGGLGVGGVAGFIWYERRKSSGSASSSQSGIDPNTGVPYSQEAIDPSTGVPYASEASYGQYGGIGTTPGQLGTFNPLTGQYTPGYGTPVVSVPGSNAQWAAAAEGTLTADGYDPATVAAALGLYLAGQPLTADQYTIVQAAIGFEGQPPVSVPAPHQINPNGGGTAQIPGGGGLPGPGRGFLVKVPNVVGMNNVQAFTTLTAAGFLVKANRGGGYLSAADPRFKVVSQTPGAGTSAPIGSYVDLGEN